MSNNVSRSVGRVFQVLEVFQARRRPLTAMEIADTLESPRSSIAVLLRSLVDLSILSHERRTSTYFPTGRLAQLADWLTHSFVTNEEVYQLVERLQQQLQESVLLACPLGEDMEIVYVVRGSSSIGFWSERGQRVPILGSAIGTAYMMTLPRPSLLKFCQRAQRKKNSTSEEASLDAILEGVDAARNRGFAIAMGAIDKDVGAICAPLPESVGPLPVVLSVAGPISRMRLEQSQIIRTLASEIPKIGTPYFPIRVNE
jgi:DNA-binding IclR family transcriptional regulator